MSFIPNPTTTEGTQDKLQTTDMNVEQLLNEVLKELKKLNLHMHQLSDLDVTDRDVD